ncbi:hypothetical protein B7494_g8042 [Chlorociboria aeruginascens]|nr:hypothetical protein B7494_g8042 [Chlorociboria aeruginascens]
MSDLLQIAADNQFEAMADEAHEDGSSSLSDIEADQEDDGEASDDLSNPSDDNDSEAETERLEETPNKIRKHKDVILNSRNDSETYERSPSKLHNQIMPENPEEDGEDEPLSEDELSVNDSPKSFVQDESKLEPATIDTSREDSPSEEQKTRALIDAENRKRKRSIMAGSGLDLDMDEPQAKRTGSVMTPGDDYVVDELQLDEDIETSNPMSGNISGDEGAEVLEAEVAEDIEEPAPIDEDIPEPVIIPKATIGGDTLMNGDDEVRNGDEDQADNEGDDEAELLQRNEEELERRRLAQEELGKIEGNFAILREKLYHERIERLNREEEMLRQDNPTHPEYLAMIRPLEARRDEKLRIARKLREYEMESANKEAVGKRSQILSQYSQEVRDIRERVIEDLGKQWYDIQHERRSYHGIVPEYTLKIPMSKERQFAEQAAYSKEVSILSGIAKHVGFPAAPALSQATNSEIDEDLAKMGRKLIPPNRHGSLQELAGTLRTAGSTSRYEPAEEQFIKQTPWANPHHPSISHLIQRQSSTQHPPRTSSPFDHDIQAQQRRHSGIGAPIAGTFSISGGRNSPSIGGHYMGGEMQKG